MGLFSALVKTAIETAKLPLSVAKDAATLGGALTGAHASSTAVNLRRIKQAADDKEEHEMEQDTNDIEP
jgi:hypothetical protein